MKNYLLLVVFLMSGAPCAATTIINFTGSGYTTIDKIGGRTCLAKGDSVNVSGEITIRDGISDNFTGTIIAYTDLFKSGAYSFSWSVAGALTGAGDASGRQDSIYMTASLVGGRLMSFDLFSIYEPNWARISIGPPKSGKGLWYNDDDHARSVILGVWSMNRITAVPEPTTWAMIIAGFGIVGVSMRRRQLALT